jgi:hypothetical protein
VRRGTRIQRSLKFKVRANKRPRFERGFFC